MIFQIGINERRVIDLLRQKGAMSRASIARDMDLGAPTLTKITQTLTSLGILRELHKVRDGYPGKPAQLVAIHPDGAYSAGISLQSEYLSVCVVDLSGGVKGTITRPLDYPEPKFIGELSAQLLRQLLTECQIPADRFLGTGICMPGMALSALGSGLPSEPPHLLPDEFHAWKNIELESFFSTSLGVPVWFENSAKAATLADAYFGAGQSLRHFASIHIAFGLGGGLILNRQLYRGTYGRAGEFGGAFPYEGTRASGRDLLLFLKEHMENPPTHIRELYERKIPANLIQQWVDRVVDGLADMSATLMAALDLEAIIFNGLLPTEILSVLAQAMRIRLPRLIFGGFGMPEILVSKLAQSGLEIGAASLPIHFVLSANAS